MLRSSAATAFNGLRIVSCIRPDITPGAASHEACQPRSAIVTRQAYIDRLRLPGFHVDLARERHVAVFLDLDTMSTLGNLNDKPLVPRRPFPRLAIDGDVGVGRLDAEDQRSTASRRIASRQR